MTVKNTQTWLSLTVNASTVWVDAAGRVIGFTPVHAVTSTGWIFHWPSGDTTATAAFTDVVGLNPGVAPFARSARILLLSPHEPYEGGDLPAAPSVRGDVYEPVRQLRDPAIFLENGRAWLLGACAGEGGIAIGILHDT
jgi:hypothetical protein